MVSPVVREGRAPADHIGMFDRIRVGEIDSQEARPGHTNAHVERRRTAGRGPRLDMENVTLAESELKKTGPHTYAISNVHKD